MSLADTRLVVAPPLSHALCVWLYLFCVCWYALPTKTDAFQRKRTAAQAREAELMSADGVWLVSHNAQNMLWNVFYILIQT